MRLHTLVTVATGSSTHISYSMVAAVWSKSLPLSQLKSHLLPSSPVWVTWMCQKSSGTCAWISLPNKRDQNIDEHRLFVMNSVMQKYSRTAIKFRWTILKSFCRTGTQAGSCPWNMLQAVITWNGWEDNFSLICLTDCYMRLMRGYFEPDAVTICYMRLMRR